VLVFCKVNRLSFVSVQPIFSVFTVNCFFLCAVIRDEMSVVQFFRAVLFHCVVYVTCSAFTVQLVSSLLTYTYLSLEYAIGQLMNCIDRSKFII